MLLGTVPLYLTELVFFTTIHASDHILFWSQMVIRSLDEVTVVMNSSTVYGYIKIILQQKK